MGHRSGAQFFAPRIPSPVILPSSAPQRVLYLVSLFPCWSETFIVREIERFIERGVDVRILSLKAPSESLVQRRAEALMSRVIGPSTVVLEAPVVVLECLRHPLRLLLIVAELFAGLWRQPSALLKSLVALWRGLAAMPAIRRFQPEWLHAHWATYPSTVAWALSRLSGVPFSFTAHAHDIFVEDQLIAAKLSDAAMGITISRYNVKHLARWGAKPEHLHVVHCGVDFSELAENLDARALASIASVGRLDPIKGFDVLVPALALLKERGVPFHCTVIGEGPQRTRLEGQRASASLQGQLDFPGAKPQETVRAALSDATIFVMPSVKTPEGNQDGIPVALMEAMATGAAVVSTTVSGIPELVRHEENGLVVAPGDAVALADALQRLLADGALRRKLGAAARQTVAREFDARTEADTLLRAMAQHLGTVGERVAHAR